MSSFNLHFFPKVFDGIVIWRVRRQLINDQSVLVLLYEIAGCFAGVIPGAILDQDDGAGELREQILEENLIAVAVEAFFNTFVKQPSAEELNCAEDLVSFAQSGGLDLGLLADRC